MTDEGIDSQISDHSKNDWGGDCSQFQRLPLEVLFVHTGVLSRGRVEHPLTRDEPAMVIVGNV